MVNVARIFISGLIRSLPFIPLGILEGSSHVLLLKCASVRPPQRMGWTPRDSLLIPHAPRYFLAVSLALALAVLLAKLRDYGPWS